jgi:hypothetical protein
MTLIVPCWPEIPCRPAASKQYMPMHMFLHFRTTVLTSWGSIDMSVLAQVLCTLFICTTLSPNVRQAASAQLLLPPPASSEGKGQQHQRVAVIGTTSLGGIQIGYLPHGIQIAFCGRSSVGWAAAWSFSRALRTRNSQTALYAWRTVRGMARPWCAA